MPKHRPSSSKSELVRWYRGPDVPLSVIRDFARRVVERFRPDKIILFGSHAYGTPHADSDVDILIVMKARNQLDQAVKIRLACKPPFPLDLIVRTPQNLRWRLDENESFLHEIVTKGQILYEKDHPRMGQKSRSRLSRSPKAVSRKGSAP
jgi:predicted nucleotidyltransferase